MIQQEQQNRRLSSPMLQTLLTLISDKYQSHQQMEAAFAEYTRQFVFNYQALRPEVTTISECIADKLITAEQISGHIETEAVIKSEQKMKECLNKLILEIAKAILANANRNAQSAMMELFAIISSNPNSLQQISSYLLEQRKGLQFIELHLSQSSLNNPKLCLLSLQISIGLLPFLPDGDLFATIRPAIETLIENNITAMPAVQIGKLIQLCWKYQAIDKQAIDFGYLVEGARKLLECDSLEKKILAEDIICRLIDIQYEKGGKVRLNDKEIDSKIIVRLLNPSLHEKVISHSLKIIVFWLQFSSEINPDTLSLWLQKLVLSADRRVHRMFADLWSQTIRQLSFNTSNIEPILKTVLEVVNRHHNFKYKRQCLQTQKSMSTVLNPVILKNFPSHFASLQSHFLFSIWETTKSHSQIHLHIQASYLQIIEQSSNLEFNISILKSTLKTVDNAASKNNVMVNENFVLEAEEIVGLCYRVINSVLKSAVKNSTHFQQVVVKELFRNKNSLANLVLMHNSDSQPQLHQLVSIVEMVLWLLNRQENEQCILLRAFLRKVNPSDSSVLRLMIKILSKCRSTEMKKLLESSIVENPNKYRHIDELGLKYLGQALILVSWDEQKASKQGYMFALLKSLSNPALQERAVREVISVCITVDQLRNEEKCQQFIQLVIQQQLSNQLQIMLYREMIQVAEKNRLVPIENIHCQLTSVKQQLQIDIAIVDEQQNECLLKKRLLIFDSTPVGKFINGTLMNELSKVGQENGESSLNLKIIRKIFLFSSFQNKYEQWSYNQLQTLRCAGLNNRNKSIPKMKIFICGMRENFDYRNLSQKQLEEICSRAFNKYMLTIKFAHLCSQNEWGWLEKISAKVCQQLSLRVDDLDLNSLIILMQALIESSHEDANLSRELSAFFLKLKGQSDIEANNVFELRKLISENSYFLSKGFEMLKTNTSTGYNFLQCLIVHEQTTNYICCTIKDILDSDILKCSYETCYYFEVLWIALKNQTICCNFILSEIPYKIFKVVEKVLTHLQQNDKKYSHEQRNVSLKIVSEGLAIISKIVRIQYTKHGQERLIYIPQDVLDFSSTMHMEAGLKQLNQDFKEDMAVANSPSCSIEGLNMPSPQEYEVIFEMAIEFYNSTKSDASFFFVYAIARLNYWILLLSKSKRCTQLFCEGLKSEKDELSSACKDFLYLYLQFFPMSSEGIMIALTNNFPNHNTENIRNYRQIFEATLHGNSISEEILANVTQRFFEQILNELPEANENDCNYSLQSVFLIMGELLKNYRENASYFLEVIWEMYLFPSQNRLPKALHPQTRKIMYKFFIQCIEGHSSTEVKKIVSTIIASLNRNLEQAQKMPNQSYKEVGKGVGLQNLSNICYMNSLLQLLHGVPSFVNGICAIKNPEMALLQQLKILMTTLSKSQMRSVSPEMFLLSFDPPIDPTLQQDTTQFFASFLDKLEEGDKTGNIKKLTSSLFKGETISKMTCSICNSSKQKIDQFLLYSVPLSDQNHVFSTLDECIKRNKEPETIFDLNCEKCKKKRDFKKKSEIKKVPNYLFIHLKRLIFDYSTTFNKIKIHSRLEFPENIEINNQKLALKGVITHSGTGEHGHYFTSLRGESGQWLLYNDSKVTGLKGSDRQQLWFGQQGTSDISSTNAYVLLYEKQEKSKLPSEMGAQALDAQSEKLIYQQNKQLTLNKIIFGKNFQQDFTDFWFELARLPNNSDRLSEIYRLLGKITFSYHMIPSMPPSKYFSIFSTHGECQDLNALIRTVYSYKKQNLMLQMHAKEPVREFTCYYFSVLIKACQIKNIECAALYASELVSEELNIFSQIAKNILHSESFLTMIANFIQIFKSTKLFMESLHSSNFIPQLLSLFQKRSLQIQLNFKTMNLSVVDGMIRVVNAYLSILTVENIDDVITEYMEKYKQTCFEIRGIFSTDPKIRKLVLLNVVDFEHTIKAIELLRLQQDEQFFRVAVEMLTDLLAEDVQRISPSIMKNVGNFVYYLFDRFYSKHGNGKYIFCYTFLGSSYPIVKQAALDDSCQNQFENLHEKRHEFLTSKLQRGLLDCIVELIYKEDKKPSSFYLNNLQNLYEMLKLLKKLCDSCPVILNFVLSQVSPNCLYHSFLDFALRKSIAVLELHPNRKSQRSNEAIAPIKQMKQFFHNFQLIVKSANVKRCNKQVLYGGFDKAEPRPAIETTINNKILMIILDYKVYWTSAACAGTMEKATATYRLLEKYVNADKLDLKRQYFGNETLLRIMVPSRINEMEMEGSVQKDIEKEQFVPFQKIEPLHCHYAYRKIRIVNIWDEPISVKVDVAYDEEGRNFTKLPPLFIVSLEPNQKRDIWINKIAPVENWGSLCLSIGNSTIIVEDREEMQMM